MFYFILRGKEIKEKITYENFSMKEKKIFFNIMIEGITDVILNNEYLNIIYLQKKDKKEIINEIVTFISDITQISKINIKRRINQNLKKEKRGGVNNKI